MCPHFVLILIFTQTTKDITSAANDDDEEDDDEEAVDMEGINPLFHLLYNYHNNYKTEIKGIIHNSPVVSRCSIPHGLIG